jgi:adenylate kinase
MKPECRGKSLVLENFPRNDFTADMLTVSLQKHNLEVKHVFELEITPELQKERLATRSTHIPSGRVYNDITNPPKVPGLDDITGEPLTRRMEDTAEGRFEKRLIKFKRT